MTTLDERITQETMQWVRTFVIELNLCPFAKRELERNTIRTHVSHAQSDEQAFDDFRAEIVTLNTETSIETTLLLFPDYLNDFFDYLDFVDKAVVWLEKKGFEGIYQIATFHPQYCFANEPVSDVTHYTNRTPYPMLHLLREAQVEKAIAFYGDTSDIPVKNMQTLRHLGLASVQEKLKNCMHSLDNLSS
jgi:hypothetical protein